MSKAKKYIFISILVMTILMFSFCLFALNEGVALADDETQYYYIPQSSLSKTASISNVGFIIDGDVKFYLPESYYLRIIDKSYDNLSKVSYMGLNGEVSKQDQSFSKLVEKTTLEYSGSVITDNNAFPILSDVRLISRNSNFTFDGLNDSDPSSFPSTTEVYYMGKVDDSKIFIMVKDEFHTYYGETSRTQFEELIVPAHQAIYNYIVSQESGSSSNQPNTNNSKALRVILIIGLIIPAVIIALLIFIPKKSEQYDKARMNSKKVGKIDYDKTRMQDPNMQQPPYQQNGYNQYPPQNYGGPQYPNYQQPQYPPQNNGYYPPQNNVYYPPQNNVYYPPQDNGYYPPQNNGYYDPNDPNGGMQ